MRFEWDEDKNRRNIARHGVAFEDARRIFDGPVLTWIDDRHDYGETREISLGLLDALAVLLVVHTERGGRIRLISARRATRQERRRYEAAIRPTADR